VAKLEEFIRNKTVVIHSRRLLEELRTFIWHNGRPEAMKGYNDDLVMSAAIGCWIRDTVVGPNFVSTEMKRQLISGMSKTSTVNTQIDGASKNPDHLPQKQMGPFNRPKADMKIRLPNGQVADFSWLISKG
jgi:hypothetical protein